jgi:small subunit ribosomal protein S9
MNKNILNQFSEIKQQEIFKSTGRRKSAVAEVKLMPGCGNIIINGKSKADYFQKNLAFLLSIDAPLSLLQLKNKFDVNILVYGGGLAGQADAIKLGIARAICKTNLSHKSVLKQKDSISLLTRDARCKERKKYGLKKARKAPQYSKR